MEQMLIKLNGKYLLEQIRIKFKNQIVDLKLVTMNKEKFL